MFETINAIAKAASYIEPLSCVPSLMISITEKFPKLFFKDWLYQHQRHITICFFFLSFLSFFFIFFSIYLVALLELALCSMTDINFSQN